VNENGFCLDRIRSNETSEQLCIVRHALDGVKCLL
jgi:hypothetical protein